MTEDEARTKRCPIFVNASLQAIVGLGKEAVPSFNRACNCLGSDCMMWRARQTVEDGPDNPDIVAANPTSGWCGLAGKP